VSVPILYVSTAVIFLALDALMLTFVLRPLFERHIGHLLLDSFRMGPVVLFYLAYIAGLVWLVSLPALRDGDPLRAAVAGAVVGAMAYGTSMQSSRAGIRRW